MLRDNFNLLSSLILFGFLSASCSNDGHAPGATDFNIPQVTKPVSGASINAIHASATSGQSLNSVTCTGCASATHLSAVWSMASIFVFQGKLADLNSCIIKSLAKANIVPGLTSGNYVYMTSSASKLKAKVVLDGGNLQSFELFGCDTTSQNQYLSGTKSGSDVTFSAKFSSTPVFVSMVAAGTMSGETWTSKTLTVDEYDKLGSNYSELTMTQQTNYLDISGVWDRGTLGTLDATDVRFVSRAQLLGSGVSNYALGDGSAFMAIGSAAGALVNWNGDTAVEGSGPTTYDSAVSAVTLPTVPTSRKTAFAASEQWNCAVSADAVQIEQVASSSAELKNDLAACIGGFQ